MNRLSNLQLRAASEVDELALAVIVEQHVVTVEVAVHEPSSMEVDQVRARIFF